MLQVCRPFWGRTDEFRRAEASEKGAGNSCRRGNVAGPECFHRWIVEGVKE
jgi:hypothetical protein